MNSVANSSVANIQVDALKGRQIKAEVVSANADKTIVVKLYRRVEHKRYGKIITKSTKLHAHDENNECKLGDFVVIQECRPLSKLKNWVLIKRLNDSDKKRIDIE